MVKTATEKQNIKTKKKTPLDFLQIFVMIICLTLERCELSLQLSQHLKNLSLA